MSDKSIAYVTAERAASYFEGGDNCAQAVVRAVRDVLGADLPAGAERFGAGFAGGIAHSGNVCGALVGGVMVLGWVRGNGTPGGSDKVAARLSGQLKREFDRACAGPSCESVREGMRFSHKKAKVLCRRATAIAAGMTADLLETGTIPDESAEYMV